MQNNPKERNHYIDNLKFVLIFLVLLGHFSQPMIYKSAIVSAGYFLIYTFHMPAFIFLNGYFAKKYKSKDYWLNLIGKAIIPYLIFQYIYLVFITYTRFNVISFKVPFKDMLIPYWMLWFLISLTGWNLLLPIFNKLKSPIKVSLLLGIIVGYISSIGTQGSLSRTIVMFPFFLIGYYTDEIKLEKLKHAKVMALAILLMVFLLSITRIPYGSNLAYWVNPEWLYGAFSYKSLNHTEWYAGIFRVLMYLINIVFTFCFMAIIPRNRNIFTKVGRHTKYPFILHGFIIELISKLGYYNANITVILITIIPLSIVATLILSAKPIRMAFKLLVEFPLKQLADKITKGNKTGNLEDDDTITLQNNQQGA